MSKPPQLRLIFPRLGIVSPRCPVRLISCIAERLCHETIFTNDTQDIKYSINIPTFDLVSVKVNADTGWLKNKVGFGLKLPFYYNESLRSTFLLFSLLSPSPHKYTY